MAEQLVFCISCEMGIVLRCPSREKELEPNLKVISKCLKYVSSVERRQFDSCFPSYAEMLGNATRSMSFCKEKNIYHALSF